MRLGQSTFEFLFIAGLIICFAFASFSMYSNQVAMSKAITAMRRGIDSQFSAAELSHPGCAPITFTHTTRDENTFTVYSSSPECTSVVLNTAQVEKEVCNALGCAPTSPCTCKGITLAVTSE